MYKTPTTRAGRKAKQPAKLPKVFTPKFLDNTDHRQTVIREVRRRIEDLKTDVGPNSVQKTLLCERAAFVAVLLETSEVEALTGEDFSISAYVQAVNSLQGLLKTLGLESNAVDALNLDSYVAKKRTKQ